MPGIIGPGDDEELPVFGLMPTLLPTAAAICDCEGSAYGPSDAPLKLLADKKGMSA